MRTLIQRVKEASVSVSGSVHTRVGKGLLVFLGVRQGDTAEGALYLAQRCANLRIFSDEQGNMNLSVKDINGEVLVISQFTLYADTRKGNRPGFSDVAPAGLAEPLYQEFVKYLSQEIGDVKVKTGVFRAMMDIQLINDGPVTVMVESKSSQEER